MRQALTISVLGAGLILAVAGFFLAAPIGPTRAPDISDPRVIFAPGIFLVGVVLAFGSAIVYELLPGPD